MRKLLQKLFDIREGEISSTLLMFSYIFSVIFCLVMLKSIRDSLFLDRLSVNELPVVFILVAISAAVVSTIYSRYSQRVSLNVMIRWSLLIIISNLVIFWVLLRFYLQAGDRWFLYTFYVWVAIFGVISTSQFWILANYVFNARQAKRLFGIIGAGAISGGIFGGYLSQLATVYGTENLPLLCILLMSFCLLMLEVIWRRRQSIAPGQQSRRKRQLQQDQNAAGIFRLFADSRHLLYLAGIVGVGVIVANLVDFQYKAVVKEIITDKDQRTAFFGFWSSNLSIISLAIQLFFTSRILRSFGVGPSLFFLPLGILGGAAALLFFPELWAAIFVKVADGSFKQSINKAGLELLALPIPSSIKPQVKSFIDVFIDSFATGIGGLLLIVCTSVLGMSFSTISYPVIFFIGLWVLLIVGVRREYVQAFRTAIEKRTIDLDEQSINLEDASLFASFLNILQGDNERQILYVLNLLENVQNERFLPYLKDLLHHPSAEIREQALRMISRYRTLDISSQVTAMVNDPSQEVRVGAINYLLQKSSGTAQLELLHGYLDHADNQIRGAALLGAARLCAREPSLRQDLNFKSRIENTLRQVQQLPETPGQQQYIKSTLARAIGIAEDPGLYPYLHILLSDTSSEVLQEAVISAGQTHAGEFVPVLISLLQHKRVRKFAREALAEYGEPIIDTLVSHLGDVHEIKAIRQNAAKVLGLIGVQQSVDVLIAHLEQDDLVIRFEVLKALNRLRKHYPDLKFKQAPIEKKIMEEIHHYMNMLTVLYRQRSSFADGSRPFPAGARPERIRAAQDLLIKALQEKLDNNLERIFRLLGLRYMPRDMFNAYLGIVSQQQDLRANAVEFLDNVLDTDLKKFIVPLVETNAIESLVEVCKSQFDVDVPEEHECIQRLLQDPDDWLKSCTLFLIAELRAGDFVTAIGSLVNNREPVVRETAQYALRQLEMTG